jgi:lipopolysaccharide/colanic/teichoic acid biosynthesis glycosyltransferase
MEKGVTVRFAMEVPVAGVGKYCLEDVGMGRYFVSLEAIPQDPIPLLIKRMMDIIGATVGLVFYVIAYLWYGPKIRRGSPGPLLFHQTRVGQNGRLFTLYKFRTMYSGAHEQLQTLYARNEMLGYIFKMKDDPRVTSIGKTLRRRHLDELPQFWNVLRGEISLVGTRPPTPNEVAQYQHHHYRRLSMRPGLTGLWQVCGNGGVKNFEDIVRLDCEYIDNWSLWLDCKILAKTVVKVMRGEGW